MDEGVASGVDDGFANGLDDSAEDGVVDDGAVDDAVDSDVRYDPGEQTPLLPAKQDERPTGLWAWFGGGTRKR